ncbi:MAG TPA: ABC transporter ATP-binding protein [Thermomicrobiales bacterium]|nr:ABC transporter ATP-binding protein [Thermomicrobiales bacterium]
MATLLDRPADAPASTAAAGDVVLEVRGLTKRFGAIAAVDDLDMVIRRGEVLGFLGPNGSGKSTTVSMVLGLVTPSAGSVHIMGQPLAEDPSLVSRYVGAIIENPAFYPYLTGRDNLRAQAMMVGGVPESRIDDLIKLVNMEGRADGKYKTFSLGMKQRIGIASTLLTDPALVILDEPTNGLDPAGQREIRSIIPRMAEEGHSVLLASHMLHEVEQVSDQVVIIRRGKKLTEGSVDDLLHRNGFIEVRVSEPESEMAAKIVRAIPAVEHVTIEPNRLVVVASDMCGAAINRALAESGIYASEIAVKRSSLEDLFLELTEEEGGEASL